MQLGTGDYNELLEFTIKNVPRTLPIYGWLDIRLKHRRDFSHEFEFCFVDQWPQPGQVFCASFQPELTKTVDKNIAVICLFSEKSVEDTLAFFVSIIAKINIDQFVLRGTKRSFVVAIANYYKSNKNYNVHVMNIDLFWLQETDYDILNEVGERILKFKNCIQSHDIINIIRIMLRTHQKILLCSFVPLNILCLKPQLIFEMCKGNILS